MTPCFYKSESILLIKNPKLKFLFSTITTITITKIIIWDFPLRKLKFQSIEAFENKYPGRNEIPIQCGGRICFYTKCVIICSFGAVWVNIYIQIFSSLINIRYGFVYVASGYHSDSI